MSNLLLIVSAAMAQDACPPDPSTLVAVPSRASTGIPFDLTPKILFNHGCADDLEVMLLDSDRPLFSDTAVMGEYSPASGWYLDPDSSYEVAVLHQGEEFTRWSFTTGSERAAGSATPTQLRLDYAWTEDLGLGVTQHITFELEYLSNETRVYEIFDPETRRRVHAGVTSGRSSPTQWVDISFPVSFSESEVCLEIVEYDHVGAESTRSDCVNNQLEPRPPEDHARRCSTGGGVSGGALMLLGLLGLARRRARGPRG